VQPEAYLRLAAREDNYWWYRARRRLGLGLLRRFGVRSGVRAIDIGCGCGGNLDIFKAYAPALVVGLDLSPIALSFAQRKTPTACFVRSDLSGDLPFAEGSFDVATIFNVLYHDWVTDDRAVLQRTGRLVSPGGLVLVFEPALAVLRRSMDRVTMGKRRYTVASLRRLAENAGLDVVFASYFSSFALPSALGGAVHDRIRMLFRREPSDDFASIDFKPLAEGMNRIIFRLAAREADAIVAGRSIPLGVGLVAVLRRPGSRG